MKALIFNGKVQQVEEESFPVAPGLEWVDIPEGMTVSVGDTFNGVFVPLPPAEVLPEDLVMQINLEVNKYIYSRYDSGTQASLTALYVGPDATEETRSAIESVWAWTKTVLVHYYTAKAMILAEQAYEWDLSQFDETDPQISLAALIGGS